jgi:hypothetical protein
VSGGVKCQAWVLGLLECAIASKLIRRGTGWGGTITLQSRTGMESTPPSDTGKDPMFKINGELLHGGQGKNNKIVNINCNHNQPGGTRCAIVYVQRFVGAKSTTAGGNGGSHPRG